MRFSLFVWISQTSSQVPPKVPFFHPHVKSPNPQARLFFDMIIDAIAIELKLDFQTLEKNSTEFDIHIQEILESLQVGDKLLAAYLYTTFRKKLLHSIFLLSINLGWQAKFFKAVELEVSRHTLMQDDSFSGLSSWQNLMVSAVRSS